MGQIYQRNEVWYSNYSAAGERIRKPLSPNKRIAQEMQDELVSAERFHGNGLIPSDMSYGTFKTFYLKHRKSNNRPNTYAHDDLAFRRIEDVKPINYLHQITPEFLEQAKIRWKEQGYGPAAIGSYVMRIKVAMKKAEDWRYVRSQPWRIVDDYVSPGKIIYYSVEQVMKCLSLAKGTWKTALLLMTRCGLRSGECRFLEWSDIDFREHLIWIHAKPFWKPKGWTPKKPHERHVDIPEDLEAHLQALPRSPGFVLRPEPFSENRYASYFKELVAKAGLCGSAHAFRHTYASWLISNGCTLDEVGVLLGHTNPATTKMYAHLMPHARRRAVDRLPALVSNL